SCDRPHDEVHAEPAPEVDDQREPHTGTGVAMMMTIAIAQPIISVTHTASTNTGMAIWAISTDSGFRIVAPEDDVDGLHERRLDQRKPAHRVIVQRAGNLHVGVLVDQLRAGGEVRRQLDQRRDVLGRAERPLDPVDGREVVLAMISRVVVDLVLGRAVHACTDSLAANRSIIRSIASGTSGPLRTTS